MEQGSKFLSRDTELNNGLSVISFTVPWIVYAGFNYGMSQLESFTVWARYIVSRLIYNLKLNLGVFVVLRENGSIFTPRRCVLSCILIMG